VEIHCDCCSGSSCCLTVYCTFLLLQEIEVDPDLSLESDLYQDANYFILNRSMTSLNPS
jgi:hypothetical protein